jgi:uncharacterized protein with PIN domain
MKFLCDQMLGNLSNWLRFFGFDTIYIKDEVSDDELLKIAENENRIIISRDKELIIRADKRNLKNIKIKSIDLDEQLKNVLNEAKINKNIILSRCSLCNNNLTKIKKKDFKDDIPNKIYDLFEEFLYCSFCNKIYWKGSHYDKILKKINKLKNEK